MGKISFGRELDKKWQAVWESESLYKANILGAKDPFYNLWMFPYPSAEGLHAGHAYASTGSDVFGRYMRMNGKDVLQPIGYDSFGIHSENYAMKIGETPENMLLRTTKNYEKQLRSLGHGYDWSRTVTTSDPEYYKWTQWLFTVCFKAGLAYRKEARVNWCPSCKTVLSDEQVIDGKCERCHSVVEHKKLTQWFLGITKYADRLLNNLDHINWPNRIKQAQRHWIGKAEGLEIEYKVEGLDESIKVWTRFWETIYGATFIVLAPEHPLIEALSFKSEDREKFMNQISQMLSKTEQERMAQVDDKNGFFTGSYAINPATNEKIPVWVSDYVLAGVGTGAVMGVPAHDTRDFDFARKYKLPIVQVVSYEDQDLNNSVASNEKASEESGVLINSEHFNGKRSDGDGKEEFKAWLIESGFAIESTNYHLRDWLISRQRYWGAPIPVIFCEHCAKNGKGELSTTEWDSNGWYSVPESELPVLLPTIDDFKPKGEGKGPLADHPEFYEVKCPGCGEMAHRETDVFDTFMDSSWYFLRYPSVDSSTKDTLPFDPEITKKWLPVNLYFGGAEHSVLHLLYARFTTQVLFDQKYLTFEEPFPNFYAHGLMIKDGAKMSKSRGNVVNPDIYVEKFGADTLRLYLMFMGPMDGSPDFRDTGIEGMQRFMQRVVSLFEDEFSSTDNAPDIESKVHKTVKKVTQDVEAYKYNTAIASIMELTNALKETGLPLNKDTAEVLVKLLSVFAPHFAEEIWRERMGYTTSIHTSTWPTWDESFLVSDAVTVVAQINGKVRAQFTVTQEESMVEDAVKNAALELESVKKWLEGKEIKKVIFVPGRVINFII